MALKLDGRTSRGRLWKELNMCGNPLNQGALLSGKMCSNCNKTPDFDKEVIRCMKCNLPFHIRCLLKPLTEEFVKSLSENPSLWWFCLSCISAKSTDTVPDGNVVADANASADIILKATLTTFKKDMLQLVSETIDRKFKESQQTTESPNDHSCNNQVAASPVAASNPWSNGFPTSVQHELLGNHSANDTAKNKQHERVPSDDSKKSRREKHVLLLDPNAATSVAETESSNKVVI